MANKELVDIHCRISKINHSMLEKNKEKTGLSINEIMNKIIYEYFEKNQEQNTKEFKPSRLSKEIRIKLSDDEYIFLENEALLHGFSSVTKEIRFRLINSISNNKLFNNIEMKELSLAINDLNKIGRNINNLIVMLRDKFGLNVNLKVDNFSELFSSINSKISEINFIITEYKTILDRRM